ncbi:Uncharacterized protein SCF082_LOCUS39109 [Durusdinium trenchii]|uniref:Uncharacterized protein n=1 Tax=Durusdinium trenchii TaxID=1381693 RepID=A0ABP0Q1Z5_9DINO
MEFERALFRIHQKALLTEPLRRFRFHLERVLPALIGIQVLVLTCLHTCYVGQSNCLPEVLRHAGLWNESTDEPYLPEDALLHVSLSNGDGITGVTLMERPQIGAVIKDGFKVQENRTLRRSGKHFPTNSASVFGSYRFALDRELVQMRKAVFEKHHFEIHNISVTSNCLVPFGPLADAFHLFDAWDGLVINELAYSLRSRGYLERLDGAESVVEVWAWSADQVESPLQASFLGCLFRKIMILLSAVMSFCLISAITGLFIRIAVHGSAVLMFPLALGAQYMGLNHSRISLNVLARSFPWIGIHVDVLRTGQRAVWPLFRSHMLFLLVQSFAYLSCNLAWRFLLYRKSSPEGFEENIFSLCSLVELFNLIFVRSVHSAGFYPKVVTASIVYLHFYIFCSLYPFHNLAFAACCSLCAYAMVYCLNHFEEPAIRQDPFSSSTPTNAHPRALFMPMLSPSWTMEAAPLWTMFYPAEPPSAFPEDAMRHIQSEEYNMP